MSAMERFAGLDAMLAEVRAEHQKEMDVANARIQTLEIENELFRAQNAASRDAEKTAERIAAKLLTQFALVETVFADVKRQALELAAKEAEKERQPEPSEPPHGLENTAAPAAPAEEYTEEPSTEPRDETPMPPMPGPEIVQQARRRNNR